MYAKSTPTKRPTPAMSRPPHTYHHSSNLHPGHGQTAAKPRSQPSPVVNPKITPRGRARLAEEFREKTYRDSLCTMCSDTNYSVFHHHFSSTSIKRMFLNQKSSDMTYMCPICKSLELVVIPPSETRRIVLASSTLYGVWDHPMPSNCVHFDIDSIVGGKVRDITRALIMNYMHMPNRMEVLVVAGINNIGAGEQAEQILEEMKELKSVVRNHSTKWSHNPPSYVVFCTMRLAPKFCTLYVPPSHPEPAVAEWTPPTSFHNKAAEVRRLNDMIIQLNGQDQLKLVRLDYQGVKRFKSGTWQHKFDNKPGAKPIWRETKVFKKLHFNMENKLKIIEHISNCFRGNAGEAIIPQSSGHD